MQAEVSFTQQQRDQEEQELVAMVNDYEADQTRSGKRAMERELFGDDDEEKYEHA